MRLLRWLFPDYFSPNRKCRNCKDVGAKSRMLFFPGHGWFCDEDCANTYWWEGQ